VRREIIESITGLDIIRMRLWSDLVSTGAAGITTICPFRTSIEWLIPDGLHSNGLHSNLRDALTHPGRIRCKVCEDFISQYPEITKPLCRSISGNCPCHRFKSISALIESISEQLLKYEMLVNKKVSKITIPGD
jgi:hypothetical protein